MPPKIIGPRPQSQTQQPLQLSIPPHVARNRSFQSSLNSAKMFFLNPRTLARIGNQKDRVSGRTVLVNFRYRVLPGEDGSIWRNGRVMLELPNINYYWNPRSSSRHDSLQVLLTTMIARQMYMTPGDFTHSISGQDVILDMAPTPADQVYNVQIYSQDFVLNKDDLLRAMGMGHPLVQAKRALGRREFRDYMASMKMYGKPGSGDGNQDVLCRDPDEIVTPELYQQRDRHHTYRYLIPGANLQNLQSIVQDDELHLQCGGTCAYDMLENLNKNHRGHCRQAFLRDNVNKFFHDHGYDVGAVTDGLTVNDVQFHAEHHRYSHCALDLGNSILQAYLPEKRNTNHKTLCYVVVGQHCIPVDDEEVVRSIMNCTATRTQGRKTIATHNLKPERPRNYDTKRTIITPKRRRSLDRIPRPSFELTRADHNQFVLNPESLESCIQPLVEGEDRETEDAVAKGEDASESSLDHIFSTLSQQSNNTNINNNPTPKKSKSFQYPLVSDTNRFHLFLSTDKDLIQAKCHPDYFEGDDLSLIHYYICTDQDNVEFLYHYLVRCLGIVPLKHAKTFNGECRRIIFKNVRWFASRDAQDLMHIHSVLYPDIPFRMTSIAGYALFMFQQRMYEVAKRVACLADTLSQYPPNLYRLMDSTHPSNVHRVILTNFKPPYSRPKFLHWNSATSPSSDNNNTIQTLIPMDQRHRLDLVRSYTSILYNQKDEYPIHDITNQLIPFDPTVHAGFPIGTYVIQIPYPEEVRRNPLWKRAYQTLSFLTPGSQRVLGYKMIRQMVERKILPLTHIRYVCPTNPNRQARYGLRLRLALADFVDTLLTKPEFKDFPSKKMINQLVGSFGGTTLPCSGGRYVFAGLMDLFHLLGCLSSEDQWHRYKVYHRMADFDPFWEKGYDYYELEMSGISYKPFHFQPVYHQILEEQAILMYDLSMKIPFDHLIQIKADALEYYVDNSNGVIEKWAKELKDDTISKEDYEAIDDPVTCLGRFKEEQPKDETKAGMYYWESRDAFVMSTAQGHAPMPLCPEHPTDRPIAPDSFFPTMRHFLQHKSIGSSDTPTTQDFLHQYFHPERTTFPGLMITGPAGTGKTYMVKELEQWAINLGLRVAKCAFTHAACMQMGPNTTTVHALFGMDEKMDVRNSLVFSRRVATLLRSLKIDILVVDEISLLPFELLEILYLFHITAPKVRLVMVGDFNQLPPVETTGQFTCEGHQPQQKQRNDDADYFDTTDIFPALTYDTITNEHGWWLQLTECKRTDDPLLMKIVQEPTSACKVKPEEFPLPHCSIPIWRFVCWRNKVRKAVNVYVMYKYLENYPHQPHVRLELADLWVKRQVDFVINKRKMEEEVGQEEEQMEEEEELADSTEEQAITTTTHEGDEDDTTPNHPVTEAPQTMYDRCMQKFLDLINPIDPLTKIKRTHPKHPAHWKRLQDFTYAVGMEVICRHTLKTTQNPNKSEKKKKDTEMMKELQQERLDCVNNRRGVIVDIDTDKETITVQWKDGMMIQPTPFPNVVSGEEEDDAEQEAVIPPSPLRLTPAIPETTLTYYDFAFNFCPGFCTTLHATQGETIREHYGILEWPDIAAQPKMAYVALTRASHSCLLHIVPSYNQPWAITDTTNMSNNIVDKLFHCFRWENAWNGLFINELTLERALELCTDNKYCPRCNAELVYVKYPHKNDNQFDFLPLNRQFPIDNTNALVVCHACWLKNIHGFKH